MVKNKKLHYVFSLSFCPDRYTFIALVLGLLSVILSAVIPFFKLKIMFIILRDIFQIGVIGIALPFLSLAKQDSFYKAGFRFDKPVKFVFISILIGIAFLVQFILEDTSKLSELHLIRFLPAVYIIIVNIFEIFFFFVYLRYNLEKAFGIIPAVVLSVLFFSFHHAGFQPEFIKLVFVGLIFISIFRIANHWLIMFPLWWICAVWDVFLRAEDISDIYSISWIQVSIVGIFVSGLFALYLFYKKGRLQLE